MMARPRVSALCASLFVVTLVAVAGVAHAAAATAAAAPPPGDTETQAEAFKEALANFHDHHYVHAAAQFYAYLHGATATAENYGWAQYFLAESLAGLGMWHGASVYYYLVAKTRSQPEVLNEALERLQAISRHHAFDEFLIFEDLLADAEFGTLPPVLNAWVQYVQGLSDYQKGFTDWGDKHFLAIDKSSPYYLEAQYVRGVHAVRERHDDEATDRFANISDSNTNAPLVKNKARLALARLLFDRGYYADAFPLYDKVEQVDLSYEQAQILTEKAWTAYYLKEYPKALGLLHALGAPSYAEYFLPDEYLLRGLIFKDLCHYLSAKNVVRAYRFKYGRALEQLKERQPMERIGRIRGAASAQGSISRRSQFLRALRHELDQLGDVRGAWTDSGLAQHLQTLYENALADQAHRWKTEFGRAADAVAMRLLDTTEQINLLDYEVSMDIYKPLDPRDAKLPEDKKVLPNNKRNVLYEFDGEYWNDELRDYQYFISSRCFERSE